MLSGQTPSDWRKAFYYHYYEYPTPHHVRPLDAAGAIEGHFHAAAFPFHPFKKGRLELKDTVRTLFEAGGLLGLLHLLHDDRDIAGVGESEFTRGACWVAPLDLGAPLP